MSFVKRRIRADKIYDNQCRYCSFEKFCDIKAKIKNEKLPPFYDELLKKGKCNSFKKVTINK